MAQDNITPSLIRRLRKKLGESQAEFAQRFGVNQATVHRWETIGIKSSGLAMRSIKSILQGIQADAA